MLLFKKDIKYSLDGKTIEKYIFKSGEKYSLDSVLNALGKSNLDFFIQKSLIEVQKQELPATQDVEINLTPIQEIQEPVIEIAYKTTKPIQDKDGNQIEVGSQFTQSELKEKGFGKRKLAGLLEQQSLIELKIVKWFHTLGILKK